MTADDDIMALRARLEDLPQELYDMIYHFTFTARATIYKLADHAAIQHVQLARGYNPTRGPCEISKRLRFSHLMHVDHASREKYAASFFGTESVFIVYNRKSLFHLLGDVQSTHRPLLRDLRIILLTRVHFMVDASKHMTRWSVRTCDQGLAERMTFGNLDDVIELWPDEAIQVPLRADASPPEASPVITGLEMVKWRGDVRLLNRDS